MNTLDKQELPLDKKDFFNILLWMPNWIGDVILVLPTLQALRARFQNSRLTVVVKPPSQELLAGHPAIDTLMPFHEKDSGRLWDHIRFAKRLKKYRFDLGVVFPNSFRSAFLLYLTGAETRIGYASEGRFPFLTHPQYAGKQSETLFRVDYFFNILAGIGLESPDREFLQFIPKTIDKSLSPFLTELRLNTHEFLIALHPGGSKEPRRWHTERFSMLCQKLIKEYRAKILLIGNTGDQETLSQIQKGCPSNSTISLTKLNLQQISAVIRKSDLFIGNDSGMMHLAALVGTPLVGIFGPGHPETTGPYISSDKQEVIFKNYPCSPCRQKFFQECKPSPHNKPYCIEDISIKDVMEAVRKIIKSPAVNI